MIDWFRRHRTRTPAEPVRITPEDRLIARHFNYTPQQWADMAPTARVAHRDEFHWAQGMA